MTPDKTKPKIKEFMIHGNISMSGVYRHLVDRSTSIPLKVT